MLAISLAASWGAPAFCAARAADVDRLYFARDQGRNLEQSLSVLEPLLAAAPDDPELLWRLARGLVRSGERQDSRRERLRLFKEAEAAARRSAALAPDSAEAHFWLGVSMARRGQARGVLRSLFMVKPLRKEMAEVLRIDPSHGGAHRVLAEVYSQLPGFAGGDRKAALREFELAASLSPNYTENYPALARAYIAAGDKDKARETLHRLLVVEHPADPATLGEDMAEGRRLLDALR